MAKETSKGTKRGNGEGSVYKRKSDGKWCASAVVGNDENGKPVRKTVYGKTRPEALERLDILLASAGKVEWIDAEKIPMSEWLDEWLDVTIKPRVKQTTYDSYKAMIDLHIVPALGKLALSKVQAMNVRRLIADMAKGYSQRTCQYVHTVLNMALKQAVSDGLLKSNPCTAVKRPVPKKKNVLVLTTIQVRELLRRVHGTNWQAQVWVSWGTGMRREEVLGLKWEDIDFKKATVTICRALVCTSEGLELGELKNAASYRTITLPPEVMKQLKIHRFKQAGKKSEAGFAWQHNNLVFPRDDGSPQNPKQYTRAFDRFATSLHFPAGVSLHTLRHTHATNLLQAGVAIKAVQQRLGHATASMTLDTYGHFVPNIQQGIAEKVSGMLKA